MLAFIYLVVIFLLGDSICRRFLPFVSMPHRFAAAFLSGLLICSWWTYLWAVLFVGTSYPLLLANLVFFITAIGVIIWLWRFAKWTPIIDDGQRPAGADKWDFAVIGFFFAAFSFLTFVTLSSQDNKMQLTSRHWSDFGPNVGVVQNFAFGQNFPADNTHFAGELIRHHFLFWFQAANLEYLGLNPSWSINILSILTMVALLILVMVLGEVLFKSRFVGRVASALFFCSGSLAYVTFFRSKSTFTDAIKTITGLQQFIQSGFPYPGEGWGIWTVDVFLQQRHFPSGIGIFLIALIFLVGRQLRHSEWIKEYRLNAKIEADKKAADLYRAPEPEWTAAPDFVTERQEGFDVPEPAWLAADFDTREPASLPPEPDLWTEAEFEQELESTAVFDAGKAEDQPDPIPRPEPEKPRSYTSGFIFAGILIGLLPLWHSAVFLSAFAILACWLVLFPTRLYLIYLALAAAVACVPQLLFISGGGGGASGFPRYHLGYVVMNPTVGRVLEFLGFSMGFKWLFIALALILAGWFHLRLFIAVSSILVITFLVQFSPELVAGHKFINIWLVIANVFVAYGIWRLWHFRILKQVILSRCLAVILTAGIAAGGIIDLFPIWNEGSINVAYKDDQLISWIRSETEPSSVFLGAKYVSHPIVMAGRRLYFGYSLYAWSAGLKTGARDLHYKRAFEERNPKELARLLIEQNIDYVAIDNAMRSQKKQFFGFNETIYRKYFETVYDDPEKRYDSLTIYKVPGSFENLPEQDLSTDPSDIDNYPSVSPFEGGNGKGRGQFAGPRGISVDAEDNLYVADSGNGRIQKFSPDGNFISTIGIAGNAEGELQHPNGIAVDAGGVIYIADSGRHRLLSFKADGTFVKEWAGPEPKFFGPRAVAVGPNNQIYLLDQGRSRVVRIDPSTDRVLEWGKQGSGEGEFREPSGIEFGGDRIYVTDNLNNRIQIFDLDGKFIAEWAVPEWNSYPWHHPDVAFDPQDKRLYVTSPIAKEILVFDSDGNRLEPLTPKDKSALENPSALAVSYTKNRRRLFVLNTGSSNVFAFELDAPKPQK